MARLDPAFGPASEDAVRRHVERHHGGGNPRAVQMQLVFAVRPQRSDLGQLGLDAVHGCAVDPEPIGFWRLVRVPTHQAVMAVEILLIRPAWRRGGYARELVAAALRHLSGSADEFWARVYLANPRALAFWTAVGLRRVAVHHGQTVHGLGPQTAPGNDEQPSIILACGIPRAPMEAQPPST